MPAGAAGVAATSLAVPVGIPLAAGHGRSGGRKRGGTVDFCSFLPAACWCQQRQHRRRRRNRGRHRRHQRRHYRKPLCWWRRRPPPPSPSPWVALPQPPSPIGSRRPSGPPALVGVCGGLPPSGRKCAVAAAGDGDSHVGGVSGRVTHAGPGWAGVVGGEDQERGMNSKPRGLGLGGRRDSARAVALGARGSVRRVL